MDTIGYLILDKATSYVDEKLQKKYSNDNRFITFIPAGLNPYFQPLYVSVNEPFNKALREKYVNFGINNNTE